MQQLTTQPRIVVKVVQHARSRHERARRLELPHLFAQQKTALWGRNSFRPCRSGSRKCQPARLIRWARPDGRWRARGSSLDDRNWFPGQAHNVRAFSRVSLSAADMEQSVQLAVAKDTRDHKVLLKIRPQSLRQREWKEAASVLSEIVVRDGGEIKTQAAPPNPLIRQLG